MTTVTYSFDISNVDWAALKAVLSVDDFDNGRTPAQYKRSAENSALNCFAYADGKIIGNLRVLSDGVCNAYMVDVWTHSAYRKQGIASKMLQLTLEKLPGQHVYLFTEEAITPLYIKAGFVRQGVGLEQVVGKWLENATKSEML